MDDVVTATRAELASAFRRWLDDYNADPDAFAAEYGEPAEYGEGAARVLVDYLNAAR